MMKKQFVVLGAGRFGSSVAMKLMDLGQEVMVVDNNEDTIQALADKVTYAVQADVTDENAIPALGIRNFDTAVVTIGSNIQASILATLMVKELGIRQIVAKAQTEMHAKVLYKIGADRVVFPEREMGIRVAKNLTSSNVMDFIELAPEYSIVEIAPLFEWIGKSIIELNLRSKYGLNVMAIRKGADINISVMPQDVIESGDVLVVIGHNEDLKKVEAS